MSYHQVESKYLENSRFSQAEFNLIASVLTSKQFSEYYVQIDFFNVVLAQLEIPATYSIYYDKEKSSQCIHIALFAEYQGSLIGSVVTCSALSGE